MKIRYSPAAKEKLKIVKANAGGGMTSRIAKSIGMLKSNPFMGASVEDVTVISNDYRYIYVAHNFVFYRIGKGNIYIVDIYHERENFVEKLFGVSLRSRESIDFWGE